MCGIVGFLDRLDRPEFPTGRVVLAMLDALGCRGPDSAGAALLRSEGADGVWAVRIAPGDSLALKRLESLGTVERVEPAGGSLRFQFRPGADVTPEAVEAALGACRGGLEVISLGRRLDLVKQVGSPTQLDATYGFSGWRGPLAIGHTRMSTESRIDLSHSQPFWAHGVPDLATVHNGHVTNYHQLRRRYEQEGVTFYTDNDSEVIGVYLRDRLSRGRSLAEAMSDSIVDLDGAYNYLVASSEGLGVVRDRFGFKPLMIAETDAFVAVATEEIALRRALPGSFRVLEPPTGRATFYPLATPALV
ncbi:glutamine phosphoribosylpyrophosphate amidotransferase [Singulisphaera sp. Ch08]|uniref:Glutamine phosphoribosylpyrophosphate amidotransferase n=1 Tax=Singulisphaera sp. Ch08 TaxID=3120278 RepID=A0AAU7CHA2_9BACT